MLGGYSWSKCWPDLEALWQRDTGWNYKAMNPSSGAYGIPHCVGLDTLILTRRGWLSHDEVQIGDETIGYNPETGLSEWTPVTEVHHGAGELRRFGTTSQWSAARATPCPARR